MDESEVSDVPIPAPLGWRVDNFNGHQLRSATFQKEVTQYILHNVTLNQSDAFTRPVKQTSPELIYTKFVGEIPSAFFMEDANEISWDDSKEVRLAIDEQENSPPFIVDNACPLYLWNVLLCSTRPIRSDEPLTYQKFPVAVKRSPLPANATRTLWLLSYALRVNMTTLRSLFQAMTKTPYAEHPIQQSKSLREHLEIWREQVFVANIIHSQPEILQKALDRRQSMKTYIDAIVQQSKVLENEIKGNMRLIVALETHPECHRYFGAEHFATLAMVYPEDWLMGLNLRTLDVLYAIYASENIDRLCYSVLLPAIYSSKHAYGNNNPFSKKIEELPVLMLCDILQRENRKLANDAIYQRLFIYHIVKHQTLKEQHMCIPFTLLTHILQSRKHQSHSNVTEALNRCGFYHTRMANSYIYNALDWLHENKILFVSTDQGPYEQLRQSQRYIDFSHVYLYWYRSYMTEASILMSHEKIIQNFVQNETSQMVEYPHYTELPRTIIDRLCGEQTAVLENYRNQPFMSICGAAGSGKTECAALLHALVKLSPNHTKKKLIRPRILYLANLNMHVRNLESRVNKLLDSCGLSADPNSMVITYSTIHRLLMTHHHYCTKISSRITEDPEQKSRMAMQKKIREAQARKRAAAEANNAIDTSSNDGQDAESASKTKKSKDIWESSSGSLCPLENVTMVVFEEFSVMGPELYAAVILELALCSHLTHVLFVGDKNQLQSIAYGDLAQDLVTGYGEWKLKHNHRTDNLVLSTNAERVLGGTMFQYATFATNPNYPIIVQDALDNSIEEAVRQTIRKGHLILSNSQFATQTHAVKDKLTNLIRYECYLEMQRLYPDAILVDPKTTRSACVRGDKLVYVGTPQPGVIPHQPLQLLCVVTVEIQELTSNEPENDDNDDARRIAEDEVLRTSMSVPDTEDEIQNIARALRRTDELVQMDQLLSGQDSNDPNVIQHILDTVLDEEMDIEEFIKANEDDFIAANVLPYNEREVFAKNECLPIPEALLQRIRYMNTKSAKKPKNAIYKAKLIDVDLETRFAVNQRTQSQHRHKFLVCCEPSKFIKNRKLGATKKTLLTLVRSNEMMFFVPYTKKDRDKIQLSGIRTAAVLQGFEIEKFALVAPTFNPFQHQRYAYMNFTRGRTAVYCIGPPEVFTQAVKTPAPGRVSLLGTLLQKQNDLLIQNIRRKPNYRNAARLELREREGNLCKHLVDPLAWHPFLTALAQQQGIDEAAAIADLMADHSPLHTIQPQQSLITTSSASRASTRPISAKSSTRDSHDKSTNDAVPTKHSQRVSAPVSTTNDVNLWTLIHDLFVRQ